MEGGAAAPGYIYIHITSQLSGHFYFETPFLNAQYTPVKLLGFRGTRYKEWLEVIRIEYGRATWRDRWNLLLGMLKVVLSGNKETKFRRKYRSCRGCLLFDPNLRRCRPYTGSEAGCGCYMPFKIALGGPCWLDENFPEDKAGWTRDKL